MPAREPAEAPVPAAATELNEDLVTRIARMVVERLSKRSGDRLGSGAGPVETIIRNGLKRLKDEGKSS